MRIATVFLIIACGLAHGLAATDFSYLSPERLEELRSAPANSDLAAARAEAITDADAVLNDGKTYSVTFQTPSVQVHEDWTPNDFFSMGPYWWPNPDTEDGLPYVHRDGEVNPEFREGTDRHPKQNMIHAVRTVALAYALTNRERYAEHAVKLLRVWFLDEETKMNPHLLYAQAIPGRSTGRGIGIIDTLRNAFLVDSIRLLRGSGSYSSDIETEIVAWFETYLDWLVEHPQGQDEAAMGNNHGTSYDVQILSIARFVGRDDWARNWIERVTKERFDSQIEADGRMPAELSRTRSWNYTTGNLGHITNLAIIAERLGIDLFHYPNAESPALKAALDFALPYVDRPSDWPYEQIVSWDGSRMRHPVVTAATVYDDRRYGEAIDRFGWTAMSAMDYVNARVEEFGLDPDSGETPPWVLPAELTDLHHFRLNFGTNWDPPELHYNSSAEEIIGSSGSPEGRNARAPVHGFELPAVENGAGITGGTYTFTLTESGHNRAVQLYIFNPDITPPDVADPEDIHWAAPGEDTREFVRTVDLQVVTPDDDPGTFNIDLTEEMLEGFYDQDGNPISAGGKIWFRMSEGDEPNDGVSRYRVESDMDSPNAPGFTINLNPLTENFDEGLDAYTATIVLGADRSDETEWETVGGALRLNSGFVEDVEGQEAVVGMEDGPQDRLDSTGNISAIRAVADVSMTADTMNARWAAGSGDIRMAIYADDGGSPGELLGETGEFSLGPGLNSGALIEPVEISSGSVYWLTSWHAAGERAVVENGVGERWRASGDYSSTDPFPPGSAYTFSAETTYAYFVTGQITGPGGQQHTLTRTDVPLRVGYEWRASAIAGFTGSQDIGLYAGASHPVENVREDFINVFMRNRGEGTSIVGAGFAGTEDYDAVEEDVDSFDSLFIARTGPNAFDVGWYDGATRNVLTTRTTTNPNVGTAIGYFGDVRDAGIVGSLTSATVELVPDVAQPPKFDAWAGDNIPEGADRSFSGSAAGDGVANGVKFAFGLDPMQPAGAGDLPSVGTDEEGRLTITYRVDTNAEGVSVVPEVALSLDPDVWFREDTGGDAPYVVIGEGTPVEGNIYEFTATAMNIEGDSAAFMRVSINSEAVGFQ